MTVLSSPCDSGTKTNRLPWTCTADSAQARFVYTLCFHKMKKSLKCSLHLWVMETTMKGHQGKQHTALTVGWRQDSAGYTSLNTPSNWIFKCLHEISFSVLLCSLIPEWMKTLPPDLNVSIKDHTSVGLPHICRIAGRWWKRQLLVQIKHKASRNALKSRDNISVSAQSNCWESLNH